MANRRAGDKNVSQEFRDDLVEVLNGLLPTHLLVGEPLGQHLSADQALLGLLDVIVEPVLLLLVLVLLLELVDLGHDLRGPTASPGAARWLC